MNKTMRTRTTLAALAALALCFGACQKTDKTSTAGGGASSQSVMTIKGATR